MKIYVKNTVNKCVKFPIQNKNLIGKIYDENTVNKCVKFTIIKKNVKIYDENKINKLNLIL